MTALDSMAAPAPYHARPSERIAFTEARLGRRIQSSRDLPDDLARALWWKRRRWYFADEAEGLKGGDNDNPYNIAVDERDEASDAHAAIISRMWATRFADRAQARFTKAIIAVADDCATLTADLVESVSRETEHV